VAGITPIDNNVGPFQRQKDQDGDVLFQASSFAQSQDPFPGKMNKV
jgi:hypothetical protein